MFMKKKRIILILLGTPIFSFSQTTRVDYVEKKNIPVEKLAQLPPQVVQLLNKETMCTLVNSNGNSLFQFQEENTGNLEMNIAMPKREEYYKKTDKGEMLKLANLEDEQFIIKDVLPKMDWKIESETQKIGEYNCQKATAIYKNIELIVWFCLDIPINDGPIMLTGLPGLIIKATIGNMLTYSATKISIEKENTTIPTFSKGKLIMAEDFDKLKAKVAEETLVRQKEAGATHIEIK